MSRILTLQMSLLNGMLKCSRALHALRASCARMLGVIACFTCLRAWCALRVHVLYELGVITCWAYANKWRFRQASKNSMLEWFMEWCAV